ncbi:RNA polymerase-binding protein DksA [Sodalis ligni]|jgi:DnaK suppressor protein|uniref:TraR/DksA family transcriptional regulator n=1 Tax=Sodalis ligni TaxID=2697027 RepID=A0A4R1NFS8_9GAMM|nr:RNA polymerase-binding protein DksA [Sodalis ligni]QWA12933.1 RNA polymerase-binding protein DksA [Sodalis ligni]TCL03526.1 TraR/DksA family transcriptional regulator [Sodalis ligni]
MTDSIQIPEIDEQTLLSMDEREYMNAAQLDFFKRRLATERRGLLDHIDGLKTEIKKSNDASGDEADKAMREEELRFLFRQIDRESRLLPKYDAALRRIENGTYGYCIETDEPIGLPRLLLRPIAERSIDAKVTQEMREPLYRRAD